MWMRETERERERCNDARCKHACPGENSRSQGGIEKTIPFFSFAKQFDWWYLFKNKGQILFFFTLLLTFFSSFFFPGVL